MGDVLCEIGFYTFKKSIYENTVSVTNVSQKCVFTNGRRHNKCDMGVVKEGRFIDSRVCILFNPTTEEKYEAARKVLSVAMLVFKKKRSDADDQISRIIQFANDLGIKVENA